MSGVESSEVRLGCGGALDETKHLSAANSFCGGGGAGGDGRGRKSDAGKHSGTCRHVLECLVPNQILEGLVWGCGVTLDETKGSGGPERDQGTLVWFWMRVAGVPWTRPSSRAPRPASAAPRSKPEPLTIHDSASNLLSSFNIHYSASRPASAAPRHQLRVRYLRRFRESLGFGVEGSG